MKTQNQLIRNHLESGKSITPLEALNLYGCFRLSARVYDLKETGLNIAVKKVTKDGKSFAKYELNKTP